MQTGLAAIVKSKVIFLEPVWVKVKFQVKSKIRFKVKVILKVNVNEKGNVMKTRPEVSEADPQKNKSNTNF